MTANRKPSPPPVSEADARVRQVELLISNLLRIGVIASLTLVVIGTIVSYVHHPTYETSTAELGPLTQPGASFPDTLHDILAGLQNLRGQAIVMVGLLALIATPITRVAVSILAFIYEKDRTYTLITMLVLALLLLSFVLGKVE
jgi:uncharacterized membrane protein